MAEIFQHIVFGSLISTLVGSLFSVLIAYEIVAKRARFTYQPLYLFNEIMTIGGLILLWFYIENIVFVFTLLALLSIMYQLYKLFVSVYSSDKRFRLLILALGASRLEYSKFVLEKNLGKMFGNLIKFYTLSLIGFLISLTPYASDIGFFSLIVGLILTLLQVD
ncbi:MAG: hypothetical protein N2Z58_05935 [Fervidobacterium sp.]|nr:hypothetical protein [Fervidobacterium sp.]